MSKATVHPIVYDADGLLVIHKPQGVLSHPNPQSKGKSSVHCAFEGSYDYEKRCFQSPEGPIWLIHRLDQDTSGILIAARTAKTALECRLQFDEGHIKKHYHALCVGRVSPEKGTWKDMIITIRQGGSVRSKVVPSPAPNAELRYRIEKFFPYDGLSWMAVELMTGKTHQIRIQTSYRRHPVLGDQVYGNFSLNKQLKKEMGLDRLCLHASRIDMKHPSKRNEILKLEAPLPQDLQDILKTLSSRVVR